MKFHVVLLTVSAVVAGCGSHQDITTRLSNGSCEKPWVFFDLGQTLVDTNDDKFDVLRFKKGAHDYLQELKENNVVTGMLVNVPEDWGKNHEEKYAKLKSFVDEPWAKDEPAFPWDQVKDLTLLPPKKENRKPAPYLFEKAVKLAAAANCKAYYQGEEQKEIDQANKSGMIGHLVTFPQGFAQFLKLNELKP